MLKYPSISKQRVKDSFHKLANPYRALFGIYEKRKPIEDKRKFKPTLVLPTKNIHEKGGDLKLYGVSKQFDKVLALNHVNLAIPQKKISGIIGASGSGKTTLLKILVGFYRPTKGKVTYKNKWLAKQLKEVRRDFGFATQEDSFYGKLTVEENLKYFGRLYGLTNKFLEVHVNNLLKLVDMEEAKHSLAENLSTGMKRRLDIACALVNDPKVLILDEPTQDLDPALRRGILNLIKKINQNGTTIIFTTHLLWEAEILCDQVTILNEGRVLTVGSPDSIRKHYMKGDEIHLETHPGRYTKLLKGIGGIRVKKEDHKVVIYTNKAEKVLKKLLSKISRNKEKLIDVNVRKPHLSEVFEAIVKKDAKKIKRKKRIKKH